MQIPSTLILFDSALFIVSIPSEAASLPRALYLLAILQQPQLLDYFKACVLPILC